MEKICAILRSVLPTLILVSAFSTNGYADWPPGAKIHFLVTWTLYFMMSIYWSSPTSKSNAIVGRHDGSNHKVEVGEYLRVFESFDRVENFSFRIHIKNTLHFYGMDVDVIENGTSVCDVHTLNKGDLEVVSFIPRRKDEVIVLSVSKGGKNKKIFASFG